MAGLEWKAWIYQNIGLAKLLWLSIMFTAESPISQDEKKNTVGGIVFFTQWKGACEFFKRLNSIISW